MRAYRLAAGGTVEATPRCAQGSDSDCRAVGSPSLVAQGSDENLGLGLRLYTRCRRRRVSC